MTPTFWALGVILLFIAWTDLVWGVILNEALCLLLCVFVAAPPQTFPYEGVLLTTALAFGLRRGMGRGDLKLIAVSGLFFPLSEIPLFLTIAGMGGLVTAALRGARAFPLGPSLALSWGLVSGLRP